MWEKYKQIKYFKPLIFDQTKMHSFDQFFCAKALVNIWTDSTEKVCICKICLCLLHIVANDFELIKNILTRMLNKKVDNFVVKNIRIMQI